MDAEDRFTALYQAHNGAILRYACRRTDPDTAGDVVAETFLVAWRRLAAMPADPDQVEPWLYGVARRVLANAQRSQRRTERVTARLSSESNGAHVPDPAAAVSERERIAQALARLAEPDQEALRLIGWEELDLAGAALAMGCSRSAMSVRLYRARRRLERALSASEGDEQPAVIARPQPRAQRMVRQEIP